MNKKTGSKKRNMTDVVFDTFNVLFMGIFGFLCAYPFYYIFINSISDNSLVQKGMILLMPEGIHFENFISILKISGFGRALVISVARTVVGTLFTLIGVSVLGYAMTRKEYWHRKFWYRYLIITMYFGAGLIPGYMNVKMLGLYNTFWVYVLGSFCSPYNMILVKTYIESIPASLEESALIDGAGYFQRLTKIVVPLSKPILATIAIFSAVGQWNAYMDTVLYTSGIKLQTLQSILYQYLNKASQLAKMMQQSGAKVEQAAAVSPNLISVRYTITAVTILPILLVYPFFQRYFEKGIMIGAVKG